MRNTTDIVYLSETDAIIDVGAMHIPQALTNMSVGYTNEDFIAELIAPVVPVEKLTDYYYVFGKEKFFPYDDSYQAGDTPGEIGWGWTKAQFTCTGHAVRGWYPTMAPSAADAVVDLDPETTLNVTEAIQLRKELNLKAKLIAALAPASMLAAGVNFDNPAFDPVAWIDEQKETIQRACGKMPNSIAMGRPAWRALRSNPNFLKHIAVGSLSLDIDPGRMIQPAQAAEKLEVKEVLVGDCMYSTAATLADTPVLQYIWDQYVLLYYKAPAPGRRIVTLASTFKFTGGVAGRLMQKWYDQNKYRQVIDGFEFYDQEAIVPGAGAMWSNAISPASVPAGEV